MGNQDDRYEYQNKVMCPRGCGYVEGSLGCSTDLHLEELRPPDLAGELRFDVSEAHADFFIRNQAAARMRQHLGPGLPDYGAWLPVHPAVLEDRSMQREIAVLLMDRLRTWTRPDTRGWPDSIVLFPRLERLTVAVRAARARWRQRAEGD